MTCQMLIRPRNPNSKKIAFSFVALAATMLAGCNQENLPRNSRHYVPIPASTLSLMNEKGMSKESPILIRSFKMESELEIWKRKPDGEYALLKTFPMCRWSGQLGPKTREGDRQVPEGFYTLTPGQMNPNSSYYVSMNVGYPNQLDKAYGRTGGLIMVHGACSSAGCLSMTDEQIAEIYAITREAFSGGQGQIQIQSMPFRMLPKNIAKFRADPNITFWKNLKEGSDAFEVTKQEPKVAACSKKYVFNATAKSGSLDASSPCPALETDASVASAVASKQREDEIKVAELVAHGTPAVRRTYIDGDQHQSFRGTMTADGSVSTRAGRSVEVSRMDAVSSGATEVAVDDRSSKSSKTDNGKNSKAVAVAAVAPAVVEPNTASISTVPAAPPIAEVPAAVSAATPGPANPVAAPAANGLAVSTPASNAANLSAAKLAATPKTGAAPKSALPAAASLPQQVPVVATAPVDTSSPFYKRWLGFGEEARAEAPVSLEPATVHPATAQPVTPSVSPKNSVRHSNAKSDTVKSDKGKQASLPELMQGGVRILPTGLSAFAPGAR